MEPLTTAVIAIGSLVATKALEKGGEKVGEALFDKTNSFFTALKQQSPETVITIEKALEEPIHHRNAVVEVKSAAQANPRVNQAMQELAAVAKVDPKIGSKVQELEAELNKQVGTVTNNTKLADSIKNVIQGSIFNNSTF